MGTQLKSTCQIGSLSTAWRIAVVVLTTLITASSLDEIAPTISGGLRILAYGTTLLFTAWYALPLLRTPLGELRSFFEAYRRTIRAVGCRHREPQGIRAAKPAPIGLTI